MEFRRLSEILRRLSQPPTRRRRSRRHERGMTLVEIMVVVVIISLVAGIAGVAVINRLEEAKGKLAYTQIKQIGEALELYKLSLRQYPSSAEGLQALIAPKGKAQPFMKEIPEDPWGNAYVYTFPGSNNAGGFDLMSYGADGVQGGSDDVTNWQTAEGQ